MINNQQVISELYPDYGVGIIISKSRIFNKEYCKIFFESVKKTIEIPSDDIKLIEKPIDIYRANVFSAADEFKLNYLAHSIEIMASGEKSLSAANFKICPLPHQLLVLDFVLDKFRPRCLLADEVGLGKTIEAALIMEELKLRNIVKRVLIITPAGLTDQWKDELKLKFSEDFSIFNKETFRSFRQLYGQETNCWLKFDNVITSIDFLKPKRIHNELIEREKERRLDHNKNILEACLNAGWDMVIFDEAHKLSKYQTEGETARYKLAFKLSETVPIFLLLSATPHRGKSYVFKNLLRLVDPYNFIRLEDVNPENIKNISIRNKKRACVDFNGKKLFKERVTSLCKISRDIIEDKPERDLYNAINLYVKEYYNYAKREKNQILMLLLILYQRIVSSSSRAILKSLGRRLELLLCSKDNMNESEENDIADIAAEEQLEEVENMSPVLRDPALVNEEIKIIENCISLAKKASIGRSDSKLRKLIEIIDDLKKITKDKNIKILIFTEFIETQKYIIESLERLGYKTSFINGKLKLAEKIIQKQKFKDEAQIMVSTDAGGEGINLQFCYIVINYDLPWNPMQIEQRIGRVDRIGQTKDVKAINFILKDTVEERVREKIEYKLELIKEQFGVDKLNDILSTLNEEFKFDRLFVDCIIKHDDELIESVSNDIYLKAREILENDDILIPFSVSKKTDSKEDFKNISRKNLTFTRLFLKNRGAEFNEYKGEKDLYFFKNDFRTDILSRHYSKVIFDPNKGIDIEDAELFCYKHPFIKESINLSKNMGKTSIFSIAEPKFSGNKGIFYNWLFTITNNFNYQRQYMIPVFINQSYEYNRRISEYLKNMDEFELVEASNFHMDDCFDKSSSIAEELAENIFWDNEQSWNRKIEMDMEKLENYFFQKSKAIEQLKIENIKKSKQNLLRKEKADKQIELKKQSSLIPELECIQIAKIVFE